MSKYGLIESDMQLSSTSRTSKSIRNSVVALLFYSVNLVLQFFSRKIFLEYLGTEILGLNTTASNLLQFLNLAELGINTAVGFTLYKPIRENDTVSINEIISLQGHLYKRIGTFLIMGAVVLMSFFPLIFKKIELPFWYTYASFSVLLFSSLVGYFYNYKQVLLTASQLHYKITYSYNSVIMLKVCAEMTLMALLPKPYLSWLILEVIFTIIAAVSLQLMTKRTFPFLKKSVLTFKQLRTKYKDFTLKIKQLFFHKIVQLVISQSSPLIIYAYISLSMVALYGNYMIIIHGVTSLFNTIFNSIGAGIGNLVAENNIHKTLKVFKELFSLRVFLLVVISFCVIILSNPFIRLWIGEQYILPTITVILMTLIMFSTLTRYTIESFIMAYGLVKDIFSPIIEATLNLGLSILLGYFWGLNGILTGTLISLIVIGLGWKPYFLFSQKFKGYYKKYLKLFITHILFAIISCGISYYITDIISKHINPDVWGFIIYSIISFITISIVYGGVLIITKSGLEQFIVRIKSFLK